MPSFVRKSDVDSVSGSSSSISLSVDFFGNFSIAKFLRGFKFNLTSGGISSFSSN